MALERSIKKRILLGAAEENYLNLHLLMIFTHLISSLKLTENDLKICRL